MLTFSKFNINIFPPFNIKLYQYSISKSRRSVYTPFRLGVAMSAFIKCHNICSLPSVFGKIKLLFLVLESFVFVVNDKKTKNMFSLFKKTVKELDKVPMNYVNIILLLF